jgi:NitT/TauT family transport system substrate-binding protein
MKYKCTKIILTFITILTSAISAELYPNRVVVTVVDINAPRYLPAILAEKLGYFNSEGLTVTLMNEREDVHTDQLLIDGRSDACVGFYHHTYMSQLEGKYTTSVLALGVTPGVKLLAAKRLQSTYKGLSDLQGKRIVISGINSSKNIFANYLVTRGGGKPHDYKAILGKGMSTIAESLSSGKNDFVVATEPDASAYLDKNVAFIAADLTSLNGTKENLGDLFPTTCLYLSSETIKNRPVMVQHLVNALLKSLKYIQSHSPEEIAQLIPKEVMGADKEGYMIALKESIQMFSGSGLMTEQAATKEQDVLSTFDIRYTKINRSETYTDTFAANGLKYLNN